MIFMVLYEVLSESDIRLGLNYGILFAIQLCTFFIIKIHFFYDDFFLNLNLLHDHLEKLCLQSVFCIFSRSVDKTKPFLKNIKIYILQTFLKF